MHRVEVIQKILDKYTNPTYLEIGVANGRSFLYIDSAKKIGVDPIKIPDKIKKVINNNTTYFQMTSDEFFKSDILKSKKIQVAFIDGLHEYKQVIRDVNNCLKYLDKQGVLILHDCNPLSLVSAIPADSLDDAKKKAILKGLTWGDAWNGDVWKAIVYFRSLRRDLNISVLNCDQGLGIISRGKPENTLNYSFEEITNMNYLDLEKNKQKLLNLKDKKYFEHY